MADKLNVDAILKAHPPAFESRPFYSLEGDCVKLYFENVDYFADRVDCWLTAYKAFDDKRLIGFKLKNIKTLVSAFDGLGLDVRVSKNRWEIDLRATISYCPWVWSTPANTQVYRDVLSQIRPQETVALEHA